MIAIEAHDGHGGHAMATGGTRGGHRGTYEAGGGAHYGRRVDILWPRGDTSLPPQEHVMATGGGTYGHMSGTISGAHACRQGPHRQSRAHHGKGDTLPSPAPLWSQLWSQGMGTWKAGLTPEPGAALEGSQQGLFCLMGVSHPLPRNARFWTSS